MDHITGDGLYDLPVVGESHYQHNLEKICGPRTADGEEKLVTAVLVPEKNNRHDKNAVRVDINGLTVGYLKREHAKIYRQQLESLGNKNVVASCGAEIRGGWDDGEGDRGHYGVWLDIPVEVDINNLPRKPKKGGGKSSNTLPAIAAVVVMVMVTCGACCVLSALVGQ